MADTNQASGDVMSGSIGRSYLIQSWNDASSYSGEQIGQRLKQSTDLYLANGKANTGLFEEAEEKPKVKQKHIRDKICPQNTTLNNLDLREQELDDAYLAGDIDENEFLELSRALGAKRQRAHKSLMKALGVSEEQSDEYHLDEYHLDGGQFDSVNPAITEPLSCARGEEVGLPRVDRERPLFAAVARVKQAFTACNQASMASILEAAKKLPKNSDFMFLTRCLGAVIIILLASNY